MALLLTSIVISCVTAAILIQRVVAQKKIVKTIVVFAISLGLLITIIIFEQSHRTYYKYNDAWIIGNSVEKVEERYGSFDLGEVKEWISGTVAYYIYVDDGILPDYGKHYYYLEYDESGIVYNVEDSLAPGG